MCLHGAYSQAGKTDHTNRMIKKVGRCPGWSEGHRATHWGSLVLCLVSRSQPVEEEFHAEGNRIHGSPSGWEAWHFWGNERGSAWAECVWDSERQDKRGWMAMPLQAVLQSFDFTLKGKGMPLEGFTCLYVCVCVYCTWNNWDLSIRREWP